MEKRDTTRALLWAGMIFFGWQMLATMIWPAKPPAAEAPPVTEGVAATEGSVGPSPAPSDGDERPTPPGEISAGPVEANADGVHVVGGSVRESTIGDTSRRTAGEFRMAVTTTSVGGGLVRAELSDYTATPQPDSAQYAILSEYTDPAGHVFHAFVTEKIHVAGLNADVPLDEVPWVLESEDQDRVLYSAKVRRGDEDLLEIRKEYRLSRQPHDALRCDLAITSEIHNLSSQPQSVILTHRGPLGLHQEDPRLDDRAAFLGTWSGETIDVSALSAATQEQSAYKSEEGKALAWAAIGNKYFVAFQAPLPEVGHHGVDWIRDLRQVPITTAKPKIFEQTYRVSTVPLVVQPQQHRRLTFDCYLGPKSRQAFTTVDTYVARNFDQQVLDSFSVGPCAFMTPTSLTRFMIWMLNALKGIVINYGVAIIILVLIVRTLLHPLTKKGQVNMMRMQQQMGSLQPRIEELKKRYGNDKARLNQEVMKLYQETGVNPASQMLTGCLPMFLQMPIWIALYTSLNYNIDMRHQPFCLWIRDLTAPDRLIDFAGPVSVPLIDLMTGPITGFHLLPILVSLSMFFQQKMLPKPKPAAGQSSAQVEQQQQMQKMMPYMTLVFGLFFYNMPSGLNLYIGASSFFGMIEQARIRKHIEKLKENPPEALKTGPTTPVKPKSPSWFEKLQKAAQEAQKVRSGRDKVRRQR